jgi:hypothetical protein
VKQTLTEIEQPFVSRKQTDRKMWFSMWVILAVASFGVAWFLMIYYAVKRRNDHFLRQQKLEALILSKLKKTQNPQNDVESSETNNLLQPRSAALWTILTIFVVPNFFLFYYLESDLHKHDAHQQEFLEEVTALAKDTGVDLNLQSHMTASGFPRNKYVYLNVGTLGVAIVYWLYRLFNDYNNHFKMHKIIEAELLRFLDELDKNGS